MSGLFASALLMLALGLHDVVMRVVSIGDVGRGCSAVVCAEHISWRGGAHSISGRGVAVTHAHFCAAHVACTWRARGVRRGVLRGVALRGREAAFRWDIRRADARAHMLGSFRAVCAFSPALGSVRPNPRRISPAGTGRAACTCFRSRETRVRDCVRSWGQLCLPPGHDAALLAPAGCSSTWCAVEARPWRCC